MRERLARSRPSAKITLMRDCAAARAAVASKGVFLPGVHSPPTMAIISFHESLSRGRAAGSFFAYSDYFHTDTKVFPAIEFLVELLQHLPDSCSRLLRTYGLYSSRARGTWSRSPHLLRLAPEGWKRDHPPQPSLRIGPPDEPQPELSVSAKQSRAAWARLIKKVYGADPLTCPRCHNPMKVIAVITDPAQVLKIQRHLINTGKPPPGLDPASFN